MRECSLARASLEVWMDHGRRPFGTVIEKGAVIIDLPHEVGENQRLFEHCSASLMCNGRPSVTVRFRHQFGCTPAYKR